MQVAYYRIQKTGWLFFFFLVFGCLFFVPQMTQAAGGTFGGGNGASTSTPYLVEDCLDLQALNNNKSAHYKLNQNVDCTVSSGWNSGAGFVPIGSAGAKFTGSLNGDGFVISDLFIDRSGSSYVGLFSWIGSAGVVSNLGVVDADVTGSSYAAIVVSAHEGTVTNVYATGTSTGGNYTAGISGYNPGGTVTDSYTNVTVVSSANYPGGAVGYLESGTVEKVFAVGSISGSNKGGVVGYNFLGTVSSSYYDSQTTGASDSGKGTSKTTAQMMTQSTFIGWNFNVVGGGTIGTWIMAGYPHLQMEHRSIITTAVELQLMNVDLTDDYTLANDIDCACSTWNGGAGFSTIMSGSYYFEGSFNGQGNTISNLYINKPGEDFLGIFAYLSNATISNVYLVDVDITGGSSVGAVAGESHTSTITNVFAGGSVSDAGSASGMLVGGSYSSNIYRSYSSGIVTTGSTVAGGLVGLNEGNIYDSYSYASVSAASYAGGLVGDNSNGNVYRSYAFGAVTAGDPSGGLIGYIFGGGTGTVTDSFYDSQTTGKSDTEKGVGKTTAQMKTLTTFTDTDTVGLSTAWDFAGTPNDDVGVSSTWEMDPAINSGYAYLAWQEADTNAPSAPTSFSAEVSGTDVSLSWTNPTESDFISLTLRRSTSAFPTTTTDGTAVTSSMVATSFVQSSLEDGTYYYALFALDNTGNASVAATSSASIDTTAPNTVSSLVGTASTSSALLSWTNPIADFSSISIRRSTSAYPTSISDGASVTSSYTGTSLTDASLSDALYYYGVFALDTIGNVSAVATTSVQIDTTAPTITLLGSATVSQGQGQSYADAGATATDAVDGTLTGSISTTGSVNTGVPGTYTIIYSVSDAAGNAATSVTRTVTILSAGSGVSTPAPSSGGGASDRSVGMNQTGDIGLIGSTGINYLAYINAKAKFSVVESKSGKTAVHTVTITDLDLSSPKTVMFEIASTPQQVRLQVGQMKSVDLDGDKKADLSIVFVGVVANRVELTLSAVSQTKVKDSVNIPEKVSTSAPVIKETTIPAPVSAVVCPSPLFTRDLRRGSTGSDVLALQQYLNGQAVPVAMTGVGSEGQETMYFGGLTEQAIRLFQENRQIPATFGVFDYPTRLYLGCESVVPKVTSNGFTRDLSLGMSGPDVRALQVYLNTHGFLIASSGFGSPGNETTYFGPATQAALRSFQQANGLPAYGFFGSMTRAKVQK